MKFSIEKNILLENLNNVIKAISVKTVIPILNGIKFDLTEEGLEITSSNSDIIIKTFIETKKLKTVEKTGNIVLQSKYILDIIRKLPDNIINFELLDSLKLKIYTQNSKYNLNCLSYEEYPKINFEYSKDPIVMNSKIFKEILNQTTFAISTQESRPLLTGLNIQINGSILECTATDSYRLAKKTLKIEEEVKESINITIPGKNIIEFDKILDEEQNINIHIFNNKILFEYKNVIFQSNLLSGSYPNTNNLIPTEFKFVINCELNDLYDSIDRASLLTQAKDKNTIKLSTLKNQLTVSSFASEIGKVEDVINIDKNEDEEIEISCSSKYMLDALKTIQSKKILLLLNNDEKPIIIKGINDETLIQLVLPIRTY